MADAAECQHYEDVGEQDNRCRVARDGEDCHCMGFPDSPEECYRWQRERAGAGAPGDIPARRERQCDGYGEVVK